MSKHNSYALKNFAELSATSKMDSLIPSGKKMPAAVNQVPRKLNFPSRFPIQHKCGMFVQSPCVSVTDSTCVQDFKDSYLTHINPTDTPKPGTQNLTIG